MRRCDVAGTHHASASPGGDAGGDSRARGERKQAWFLRDSSRTSNVFCFRAFQELFQRGMTSLEVDEVPDPDCHPIRFKFN